MSKKKESEKEGSVYKQTDMFGDAMEPFPEPIASRIGSPQEILDMIQNGKIANTREEFLGIPPKPPKIEAAAEADHTPDFRPLDPVPPASAQPPAPTLIADSKSQAAPQSQPSLFSGQRPQEASTPSKVVSQSDQSFEIPKLPVTDEDIMRFLSCIKEGKYYSEIFTKGGYSVTFRVKSATEIAWVRACLSHMIYETKEVKTLEDMNQAILRFNLILQTVAIDGRVLKGVAVPGLPPWAKDKLNLEKIFWDSEFSVMPETTLFLIQSLMVQFETKVRDIERALIDPKFSSEGARS